MSFPISITWSGGTPPVAGFQQMAAAAAKLDASLATSAGKFDQFASSVGKIEGPIGGVAQGVEGLNSSIGGIGGAIGPAASGMESFAGSTETLNGAISETGGFVTEATGSMSEFGGAATEAGTGATELGTASTEANTGVTELGTAAETTVPTFADMATGATDSGTAVTELGTAATEGGTKLTEMGTAATDTTTAEADLTTATTDTNTALGESVDALGNVVPGLQDTAAGAADSAQGFSDLAPPVEDTNAALDSSSGLLEGVAPLLGTTGENAGTAATTTEDFSGALGGLNTELPGVTGGLTTGNTLVSDFGTEAGTTQGKTDDLKGSMASLAFGLTTLVSSGLGLVGAFTSIRDAGFKVEAANIKAEKATTALDKAMIAMGKSIQKLATDSEAPISGMGRLQTAFAAFQKLIDAGITRGPQYTAALNELKAAGDALEGSTNKDNTAIATLNANLDGLGQKAAKADLENRKLTKSLEAQAESYVQAGLTLSAFAGGIGSTIQTITTMGSALGVMKGALIDIGIVMSQSVIPALAGIAVPVGIAVAAIVGFIAAVTAIRANIKIFDDMGVAIGKVFPAMIPMLQGARQAFINFSDAINSSVSVILGGIDALTGGTLKLKEHWDGFTSTLPKGTANVNTLDQAIFGLAAATGRAGETAKLTAGEFKIVGDSIVRVSDGAKIGRTHWQMLDATTVQYSKDAAKVPPVVQAQADSLMAATTAQDAMGAAVGATGVVLKEQTSNYSELTNAQKFNAAAQNLMIEGITKTHEEMAVATAVAVKYLEQIAGVNTELFTSNAIITGVADALMNQTKEHFEAVRAAADYVVGLKGVNAVAGLTDAQVLKLAEDLKKQTKETGTATQETSKHAEALKKMQQSLTDTSAELTFYADASNTATRMQLEFNTGVAEAQKKIQDETFALAKLSGELSVWNDAQQRATAIGNAFARGLLEQQKAAQQLVLGLAQAVGKLQELERQVKSGQATLVAFQSGLVEGKTKALEFGVSLAKSAGETVAFEAGLRDLAVAAGVDLADALSMSASQMEMLLGAIAGSPEAVRGAIQAFDEMGQKIVESLAKAGEDGKNAFMDNIKAMQKELGVTFSKPLIQKLEVEANIEKAKQQVTGLLGVLAATLRNQPLEVALKTEAAQSALSLLQSKIQEAVAQGATGFGPLQSALDKLGAWKPGDGMTKLPGILAEIVIGSQNLEGGMQGAITSFNGLFQSVAAGAGGLESLKAAFEGVGLTLNTTTGKITNAAGVVVAELGKIGPAAGTMATQTDAGLLQMTASGDAARDAWARDMQIMFLAVDQFGKHAQTMALTVSGAYSNMSANVTLSLNKMASGFLIILAAFVKVQSDSQRMASTVSGSFSNMSSNSISAMNKMASGIIVIISSFTKISSEAARMNSAVSSAMSSMASKTSSFASTFSSAMSKVSSSASSATSAVSRLASAINSLKSKSITITVTTVYRTVYAAGGGAFISSAPQRIGPMRVSEFGQKELVTVTPLEGPGRNKIKGLSDIMAGGKEKAEKKAGRMLEREATEPSSAQKEMVMMRETPIIIQVDGREIARVVNKRIFEESDALV